MCMFPCCVHYYEPKLFYYGISYGCKCYITLAFWGHYYKHFQHHNILHGTIRWSWYLVHAPGHCTFHLVHNSGLDNEATVVSYDHKNVNDIVARSSMSNRSEFSLKMDPDRAQCYKTFNGRNSQVFVMNYSVCPWQAFPAESNVCE